MTYRFIAEDARAAVEVMKRLADRVEQNDRVVAQLLDQDHVAARIEAEQERDRLLEENERLRSASQEYARRSTNQTKNLQKIRRALNGSGTHLPDHAEEVFAALKKAAPDHPLVVRKVDDD